MYPGVLSLTSTGFGWLMIAVTLAVFGAVVAWLPRAAGRGPKPVLARAGLVAVVALTVVSTVAVQLNDRFLFFAGWGDLAGALRGTPVTSAVHRGGGAEQAARAQVPGAAATPSTGALQALPRGSRIQDGVTSYQITGPLSEVTAGVQVTVPPGYDPADPTTTYPVLETFTGYPASVDQWVKAMGLQTQVADEVAVHRLHRMILVSPQWEVPRGTDTECVDGGAGNPQLETFVTRDVPNWVAAHFRVSPGRGSWAAIGLSAGGWCAAMAAMLHPAQYGGAIVMGGYFRPDFGPRYEPFPAGSDAGRRYDLVALARRSPPPLALWVETSHADPLSFSTTTALLSASKPPLSVTAVVLQNAGHRIGVWQGLTPEALRWLGASVPGFAP